MTDVQQVLKEFTKTKEMTFAWAFRGVLAALVGLSIYVFHLAENKLNDVSTKLDDGAVQFPKLNTLVQTQFAKYDEIREVRDIQVRGLTSEVADHENRIRTLERK
jgi:hypothetical protein